MQVRLLNAPYSPWTSIAAPRRVVPSSFPQLGLVYMACQLYSLDKLFSADRERLYPAGPLSACLVGAWAGQHKQLIQSDRSNCSEKSCRFPLPPGSSCESTWKRSRQPSSWSWKHYKVHSRIITPCPILNVYVCLYLDRPDLRST